MFSSHLGTRPTAARVAARARTCVASTTRDGRARVPLQSTPPPQHIPPAAPQPRPSTARFSLNFFSSCAPARLARALLPACGPQPHFPSSGAATGSVDTYPLGHPRDDAFTRHPQISLLFDLSVLECTPQTPHASCRLLEPRRGPRGGPAVFDSCQLRRRLSSPRAVPPPTCRPGTSPGIYPRPRRPSAAWARKLARRPSSEFVPSEPQTICDLAPHEWRASI